MNDPTLSIDLEHIKDRNGNVVAFRAVGYSQLEPYKKVAWILERKNRATLARTVKRDYGLRLPRLAL